MGMKKSEPEEDKWYMVEIVKGQVVKVWYAKVDRKKYQEASEKQKRKVDLANEIIKKNLSTRRCWIEIKKEEVVVNFNWKKDWREFVELAKKLKISKKEIKWKIIYMHPAFESPVWHRYRFEYKGIIFQIEAPYPEQVWIFDKIIDEL